MTRMFFDVSDLRRYLTHAHRLSGIQRVTVMVIEEAAQTLGGDTVYLSFHDAKAGRYRCVRYADLGVDSISSPTQLSRALDVLPAVATLRPSLERYRKKPVKRAFHATVRDLNAAIGNKRHFERRNITIEAWKNSNPKTLFLEASQKSAFSDFDSVAKEGDRLLLLDASWEDRGACKAHRKAHDNGIRVYSLIHDLIPIVTPEFVVGHQGVKFHNWLHGTLEYVDVYLANSKATAKDLRAFLKVYDADIPVRDVPLAQARLPAEIDAQDVPERLGSIDQCTYAKLYNGAFVGETVRALLKRPYALCVGTIEARKNTWSMVQAWDRMVSAGVPHLPKLVFAGRPGWLNADFDRFMERSGNLGGWVEILHGPSDQELDHLYRNCLFTIFVSYKEGWGLPIGEGLSYGKTGVVSGVSSMPEVGGDLVEYCDPLSIASIEAACRKLVETPEHRENLEQRIAETPLRSWSDVARDVISAVRD
ncbi:MAG: glycosyltransferase family 1 protein [Pseudomonadota bacterium]